MPCDNCGSNNWHVVGSNGVTDPRDGMRIEDCECQECGFEWRNTLA